MKRFVIHIKGSSRYSSMVKELDKYYKDEYTVFDAIVKPKAHEGISESFRKIISENYNEPQLHIFEDDIMFRGKDARKVFEDSYNSLPKDWELYLAGSYTYTEKENLGNLLLINDFRSLHNIVINKSAYDYFLSHDPKITNNIDTHVSGISKKCYLCNPQIAVQYNGYSYNRGKEVNYDNFLIGKNIAQ